MDMELLFDLLNIDPVGLERIRSTKAHGIIHIGFRIVKKRLVKTARYPLEIHKEKNNA